jgi:signal transduction histidine kinase
MLEKRRVGHTPRVSSGVISDAERLRRLQALTDAALSSLELDELLAALLERSRGILDADTCAVLILDEQRNELVARAAVGLEEEVAQGVRIPVGRGFAGRVAAERRPVILDDVEHADVLNPILREKGIKSLLGVPLLARGKVIGVLHVGTLTRRRFTDEDAELLRLAAERAAVGVENARLYESERDTRRRIEHVQAVTDAALAHLEIDPLLDMMLPRIRHILEADTCVVLLLDDARNELVARAAVGLEEEVERGVRIPVGRGFAGRVAAERRPVILDDVEHADVLNPILREKGVKSLLGVPMLARGELVGVLHVGCLTPRQFTDADVEMLALVADRVALAVERGRLHEDTVKLEELKSNFVAIASHELRTPASSVYGVLATLAGRGELPSETRDALVHVGFEQAERLRRLIEQLLDLSQLDARRVPIARKPVVLRVILGEIVAATVPDKAHVQFEVPPGLAAVIDPLVLDRIVSNLLINATRYGRPPIVLSAEGRDRHLRIAIEDSGSGISEELQPQLFERFARGEDARGSGLGLTIARAYARAHGGDLVFAPGAGGARFELILPQG